MPYKHLVTALLGFFCFPLVALSQFEDIQELGIKPHDPFYTYNRSEGACLRKSSAWTYNAKGDSIPAGEPWQTTFDSDGYPTISLNARKRPVLKRRYQDGRITEIKKSNSFNESMDRFYMEYDEDGRLVSLIRYLEEPDGSREKTLTKTYVYGKEVNRRDSVTVTSTYGKQVVHRVFRENGSLESFQIYSRGKVQDSGHFTYDAGVVVSYQVKRHYKSGNITEDYTCSQGRLDRVTFEKNGEIYRTILYQYTPEGHIERIVEKGRSFKKQYFTYQL